MLNPGVTSDICLHLHDICLHLHAYMILIPEYIHVSDRTKVRKHTSFFSPLFLEKQKYYIIKVIFKKLLPIILKRLFQTVSFESYTWTI